MKMVYKIFKAYVEGRAHGPCVPLHTLHFKIACTPLKTFKQVLKHMMNPGQLTPTPSINMEHLTITSSTKSKHLKSTPSVNLEHLTSTPSVNLKHFPPTPLMNPEHIRKFYQGNCGHRHQSQEN
jgi:hypothetical protein